MGAAHVPLLSAAYVTPAIFLVMRVVIGHSSRPLYPAPSGASDERGSGPGTNLGGSGPLMSISSRFLRDQRRS